MSEHWPMLEGPKDVTGEAKVGFDAWAAKHYTRPRDGAAAVTEDPTELKRLLDSALEMAHAHALPQIPHGRPPSERSEYKITMNFGSGRYLGILIFTFIRTVDQRMLHTHIKYIRERRVGS